MGAVLGTSVNIYTKWAMKNEDKKYYRLLAEASTIGLQVALSIFIGLGFGIWLDRRFDTFPKLAFVFLIFGIIAGFLNYYRFAAKQQKEDSKGSDK